MDDEAPCFGSDDVELIEDKVGFSGFFQLNEYTLRHRLIKGGWSVDLKRECFIRPPSVAVLLYDPYEDKVVLIEQFRVGAMWELAGPWTMELVAGILSEGESREELAHRESLEESGCELLDLEYICQYLSSPGVSNEKVTLYVGGVDSKNVGGRHGMAHEGEDIWVQVYERKEAWKALEEGYINNAATIIALQWLELNHQRLQAKWK
ncbi:MAG: NUDIX domain-containing protein [Pseudomonadales bacterium]|nr:NUDIX domain-containing protein [Pseudomonadales bacterium]